MVPKRTELSSVDRLLLELNCIVCEVRELVYTCTSSSLLVSVQIFGLIWVVAICAHWPGYMCRTYMSERHSWTKIYTRFSDNMYSFTLFKICLISHLWTKGKQQSVYIRLNSSPWSKTVVLWCMSSVMFVFDWDMDIRSWRWNKREQNCPWSKLLVW